MTKICHRKYQTIQTYSDKLNKNFNGENTKLFAANLGELTSDKHI